MIASATRAFADRREAGRELAEAVGRKLLPKPIVVLGLPRGGVPVAFEVARALDTRLGVLPVRKIGLPQQPELAIGAVASGDVTVQSAPDGCEIDPAYFAKLAQSARKALRDRERVYAKMQSMPELSNRTVVIVDDGLATGATMLAAIRAARKAGAVRVVAAAPVASDQAVALIRPECDAVIMLRIPRFLDAVGSWYLDFTQVDDAEVENLLASAVMSNGPEE